MEVRLGLISLFLLPIKCNVVTPVPVVMWHGMGDNCCNPFSMGYIKGILEEQIPGVYVRSLEIGNNPLEDTENGFFLDVNTQVQMVCDKIGNDLKLSRGYNAIGFSQGSQFLRAVAQRCPKGMKNLISIGGQHQGIYGLPRCFGEEHVLCDYVRRLLTYGAYVSWIQDLSVQAQYWHDPLDEETYREKSKFIADINNERGVNLTYKNNLMKLEHFVMVKFKDDTMVDPKDSSWFEFFEPGQAKKILPLRQSQIYLEDRLGLKAMDKRGKLVFLESPGNHLQITEEFLVNEIINKYLK